MLVQLSFVPIGGGEQDYGLTVEMPVPPRQGDWLSVVRPGQHHTEDFIVRNVWWKVTTGTTGRAGDGHRSRGVRVCPLRSRLGGAPKKRHASVSPTGPARRTSSAPRCTDCHAQHADHRGLAPCQVEPVGKTGTGRSSTGSRNATGKSSACSPGCRASRRRRASTG